MCVQHPPTAFGLQRGWKNKITSCNNPAGTRFQVQPNRFLFWYTCWYKEYQKVIIFQAPQTTNPNHTAWLDINPIPLTWRTEPDVWGGLADLCPVFMLFYTANSFFFLATYWFRGWQIYTIVIILFMQQPVGIHGGNWWLERLKSAGNMKHPLNGPKKV